MFTIGAIVGFMVGILVVSFGMISLMRDVREERRLVHNVQLEYIKDYITKEDYTPMELLTYVKSFKWHESKTN